MQRRTFLQASAWLAAGGIAARGAAAAELPIAMGTAEHCLFLWLGGGMAQIDTFDPKQLGDIQEKIPGSYYPSISTSVPGVEVCQHLSRTAHLMEHVTAVRTVHHDVIDEHAAAVLRVHTGRPTSGTIEYPSIGSIVTSELGPAADKMPGYVVLGYPSSSRGAGYLGTKGAYLYVTDHEKGPAAFQRSQMTREGREQRRRELLSMFRAEAANASAAQIQAYETLIGESERLTSGTFMETFDLTRESDDVQNLYGQGFGQRCLVGRRLIERGVRFVEISHNLNFSNGTGWDTHGKGQENQHLLIEELDQALAALISDLQSRRLLDKTLIVVGTEFGRPAEFDSKGGRGHHGKAFTLVLAGGGLKHCGAYGVTDEKAMAIVDAPVSIPDFHATILASMGINPAKSAFDSSNRPVPLTDHGTAIASLF
ncbi:DUF1501 domain-containing protein [Planctomicrobium sp. SH664]|uniref:DUF1501 domain-containing protein n=1 Tax=Planctomicrobium sp. SH664 TaxID=3448125 RepID=UPI003F5C9E56